MLNRIKSAWRNARKSTRLRAIYSKLDSHIQPAIAQVLREGKVAVVLGAAGTGKSTIAQKILHDAFLSPENMDYDADLDLILDDVGITADTVDQALQMMNLALGSGRSVILIGQYWCDVSALLEGLGVERFRVFNLNKVWGLNDCVMTRRIPGDVVIFDG